jgi:hypothetical protein
VRGHTPWAPNPTQRSEFPFSGEDGDACGRTLDCKPSSFVTFSPFFQVGMNNKQGGFICHFSPFFQVCIFSEEFRCLRVQGMHASEDTCKDTRTKKKQKKNIQGYTHLKTCVIETHAQNKKKQKKTYKDTRILRHA